MQDYRKLVVWQAARKLTGSVYRLTTGFPHAEEFGLKVQLRRASVSICSNIAEGSGRRGDREFRRFLDVAMGSICELECELILCVDLALISEAVQTTTQRSLTEVRRMLSGLISSLKVSEPEAPRPRRDSGRKAERLNTGGS